MRAIVFTEYGPPDVLRVVEMPTPAAKPGEVLIGVRAASVNALDWRMMRGEPFLVRLTTGGLRKPKLTRAGVDVAGVVEEVGASVARWLPGDEVFGTCEGAFAEYACTREDKLARKPANVSFEEAAAVPVAAITALQGLRDRGRIRAGQRVLIEGASGGVGSFAVQVAKAFEAQVTAVCSTANLDIARASGADHVIDYRHEDFTRTGQRYDLIFAANGYRPLSDYRRALDENGVFVIAGGGGRLLLQSILLGPLASLWGRKKLRFVMASQKPTDMDLLREFLAAGKLRPVIERTVPLEQAAEAVRHVDAGHARGKVVISVGARGAA